MESYGEILRKKREEKDLDLERIAREISIERRYLEGLENEDNGVFPGEAYMVGFLKNYAAYLELDSDFVLKLYRNKQIQEAPLPQGLYVKQKPKFLLPAIIVPIVLVVGVIVTVSVMLLTRNKKDLDTDVVISSKTKNHQYELSDKKFEERLYKGDQLFIPTG